jgi:hypothetical protein
MTGKRGMEQPTRRITDITQHRWWRYIYVQDFAYDDDGEVIMDDHGMVHGTDLVMIDNEPTNWKTNHWYWRGQGSSSVSHDGAFRDVRVTLYREWGDRCNEYLNDYMFYNVKNGCEDSRVGKLLELDAPDQISATMSGDRWCGDADCINPWHATLVPKGLWVRTLSAIRREERKNAARDPRDQYVMISDKRVSVGLIVDTRYLDAFRKPIFRETLWTVTGFPSSAQVAGYNDAVRDAFVMLVRVSPHPADVRMRMIEYVFDDDWDVIVANYEKYRSWLKSFRPGDAVPRPVLMRVDGRPQLVSVLD